MAHTTIAGLYKVEPIWGWIKWTPLRVLWSGHQAVILFFLLSGFALATMLSSAGQGYWRYALARVARLWPPYMASIILALAAYQALRFLGAEWEKGWMNTVDPAFDLSVLLTHALMVGPVETSAINPPLWSIVHEMRISLIFPVVFAACLRWGVRTLLVSVCASIAFATMWRFWPATVGGWIGQVSSTLHYTTFFVVGALIAIHKARLVAWASSLDKRKKAAILLTALVLYAYPFDNPWSLSARAVGDLAIAAGAGLLVVLAIGSDWWQTNLQAQFLGRISYSLYLNHILVLNCALILLYHEFGAVAVWTATLPLSVALAYFMWKVVELPSIRLSRRAFSGRWSAAAPAAA